MLMQRLAAHELRWKASNGYILGHCLDWMKPWSAWFWGSDYSVSGPRNLARFTADVSGLRSLARYTDRTVTGSPLASRRHARSWGQLYISQLITVKARKIRPWNRPELWFQLIAGWRSANEWRHVSVLASTPYLVSRSAWNQTKWLAALLAWRART